MIVKKIAVGNMKEAYIESSLNDSFNIISSDDNNRGKTIIIQSLGYVLGNAPVFPATFNYKEYFHLVEIEINNIEFLICRHRDKFIVHQNNSIMILDGISEYKKYWSKNISKLPRINKDGKNRTD